LWRRLSAAGRELIGREASYAAVTAQLNSALEQAAQDRGAGPGAPGLKKRLARVWSSLKIKVRDRFRRAVRHKRLPDPWGRYLFQSGADIRFCLDLLGSAAPAVPPEKTRAQVSQGQLFCRGWIVFAWDPGQLKKLELVIDGRAYEAGLGRLRRDVAEHFKEPEFEHAGFVCLVDAAGLKPGGHRLTWRAVSVRGWVHASPVSWLFEL
jgi:hypothetical protein